MEGTWIDFGRSFSVIMLLLFSSIIKLGLSLIFVESCSLEECPGVCPVCKVSPTSQNKKNKSILQSFMKS